MNIYRQLEHQRKTNKKKEEYKYFVGTTLKPPLQYAIGEKMVFRILSLMRSEKKSYSGSGQSTWTIIWMSHISNIPL